MNLSDNDSQARQARPRPLNSDAPSIVPAREWAHAMDEAVADTLPVIAGGLTILYVIFAFSHFLLLPSPVNQMMAVTAGLSTLVFAGLYLVLSRRKLPKGWGHPVGFLFITIILLNIIFHMYLMKDPGLTINLVLLIAALGFFLLAANWLAFSLIVILAAWASMIILIPSPQWGFLLFAIITALVLTILAHMARVSTLRKLELVRIQNEYYRSELQTVLITTEEAQRSLATSMAVSQRITSILDLDTLLTQVAILIQQRFNLYAVSIFLIDELQENIILHGGTGKNGRQLNIHDPASQGNFRIKIGDEDSIVGWVAARRRPLNVEDVTKDQRYVIVEWLNETRSELALPLEFGTHMLGVLDLQSAKTAAFRDENVPFLQLLADQVAIAINNARLYQSEKTRLRLTENLYGVGKAMSSTLNEDEVLDLILKHLNDIVRYDRASVLLREGNELQAAALRGFPPNQQHFHVSIKSNDVFEEIIHTHQPLALEDANLRANWTHIEGIPTARSWLGIPLTHANEVIGMLSLTRLSYDPYTRDEISLASTFASQAAIALRNASLYDQIRRFNADLENLVSQRTEALHKTYEQLEQLDRAKSDFIGVASHELRTPLTVVQGYSQMLLEEPVIKAEDRYNMLVKGILSGVQRLMEIIESMLDVAKIDNRELMLYPTPVPVPTLISTVIETIFSTPNDRQVRIIQNTTGLPSIQADVDGVRKVFRHLILNAIKFTPDGNTVTIRGKEMPAGAFGINTPTVEVVIEDTGIGIDPSNHELIFNKFFSTERISLHSTGKIKYKGKGPGLGLSIAKGIVEAHGGKIWVESPGHDEENFPGSQFHVVLPIRQ